MLQLQHPPITGRSLENAIRLPFQEKDPPKVLLQQTSSTHLFSSTHEPVLTGTISDLAWILHNQHEVNNGFTSVISIVSLSLMQMIFEDIYSLQKSNADHVNVVFLSHENNIQHLADHNIMWKRLEYIFHNKIVASMYNISTNVLVNSVTDFFWRHSEPKRRDAALSERPPAPKEVNTTCPYSDPFISLNALSSLSADGKLVNDDGVLSITQQGTAGIVTGFLPVSAIFSLVVEFSVSEGTVGYIFSKAFTDGTHLYSLYYNQLVRAFTFFYMPQLHSQPTFLTISLETPFEPDQRYRIILSINVTDLQLVFNKRIYRRNLTAPIQDCHESTTCVLMLGARPGPSGPIFSVQGNIFTTKIFYCVALQENDILLPGSTTYSSVTASTDHITKKVRKLDKCL